MSSYTTFDMHLGAQQGFHNVIHTERPDIAISLSTADEQDRLTRNVRHGQCRADLVVLPRPPGAISRQPVIVPESRSGPFVKLTIVSNFVKIIPSIPLALPLTPNAAAEKSLRLRSNLLS